MNSYLQFSEMKFCVFSIIVRCLNVMNCFYSCRFTELYVEELRNEGDLQILIMDYLRGLNVSKNTVQGIVK